MLLAESVLKSCLAEASDGSIGSVHDCLFDARTWTLRWLVVDTREWLTGRKVLIHPSAFAQPDIDHLRLPVRLTKAQISTSPEISFDRPVSKQMEKAQDSEWDGGGYFSAFLAPPYAKEPSLDGADPNLRSMAAVEGYHVGATDGSIGHIENFILDTAGWDVRYLIVDTKDWWFGQHVLISPFAVQEINWVEQTVRLDVSRESVKNSPPWKPFDVIDKSYQERLHGYYMWPAYGF